MTEYEVDSELHRILSISTDAHKDGFMCNDGTLNKLTVCAIYIMPLI
jgi:hypothetical protein